MTRPTLLLTCRACGWRPDGELADDKAITTAVLAHHATEHPDLPPAIGLVSYCPRDLAALSVRMTGTTATGLSVTTYDCPVCQRTYRATFQPVGLKP